MADETPAESPEERWPLQDQLEKLESYDLREVEGRDRLGALAFEEAPAQIREIIDVLHELRQEPWDRLDPNFGGEVTGQLNALVEVIEQMLQLTAAEPGATDQRTQYEQQLRDFANYFRTAVRPRCITARIRDEIKAQTPSKLEADTRDRIVEAQNTLADLQAREAELTARLEALEPVAEAQREPQQHQPLAS